MLPAGLGMQAADANAQLMWGASWSWGEEGDCVQPPHLRNKDMREILDPQEDSKDSMAGDCCVGSHGGWSFNGVLIKEEEFK